jgi:glycine betaine/proline transport system substrate-binding protein
MQLDIATTFRRGIEAGRKSARMACLGLAVPFALSIFPTIASAAECGQVTIADMNWSSASFAANVDKIILESAYGCSVNLVPGDTLATFASMTEKAQPDIAPEQWVNLLKKPLEDAVNARKLRITSRILSDGGVEGWYVPTAIVQQHPDIKTVQDALKHPELFPAPEDSSKGAIYNCAAGMNCQITNAQLFKALGAKQKGFVLVDPGTQTALSASLAAANERHQGWFGYYWGPSSLLGKYKMTRLTFGVNHDATEWARCTTKQDCPDPKLNSYPTGDVFTVVTEKFASSHPDQMKYLNVRSWHNAMLVQVLAWMEDNKATGEDGARYFIKTYPNVWKVWLTPEQAQKVTAAIN